MAETPTRETQDDTITTIHAVKLWRGACCRAELAALGEPPVDVAALRALVEEWELSAANLRQMAEHDARSSHRSDCRTQARVLSACAKALAALLPPVPPEKG